MSTVNALFQKGKRWENGSVQDPYAACVICGAPVGKHPKKVLVDITSNKFCTSVEHEEVVPWPIGSECLKKHPEMTAFLEK